MLDSRVEYETFKDYVVRSDGNVMDADILDSGYPMVLSFDMQGVDKDYYFPYSKAYNCRLIQSIMALVIGMVVLGFAASRLTFEGIRKWS